MDNYHMRIRVTVESISSKHKATLLAQHWADVPLSQREPAKQNATRVAIQAVKELVDANPVGHGAE